MVMIFISVHIQPGKVIATIEHVSKSYGEKQVLQDVNLLIERGSKWLLWVKTDKENQPWLKL